jgi:hypothetical protein
MYAESRRAGTTREGFRDRWAQHGAFALAHESFRGHVRRYVHHDPVPAPHDFPGASDEYDALGEITAADPETLTAILRSPDMNGPIREDGAVTFARVRTINATVEEHRLRAGPVAPLSVSTLLAGETGIGRLTGCLIELHERLLHEPGPFSRLARRVSVSPAVAPTSGWDSFAQVGFDDRGSAASAYRDYTAALLGSTSGVTRSLVIVSTPRVLWEAPTAT